LKEKTIDGGMNVEVATGEDGTVSKRTINWMKIKCFRFLKKHPEVIEFEERYDEDNRKIEAPYPRKSRSCLPANGAVTYILKPRYNAQIPISAAKKDLIFLCEKGVIRAEFHDFYRNLPSAPSKKDRLPQPDANEESQEDE